MPLRERLASVDKLRSWTDQIPLHYKYTAGVAGERFLRGLQKGVILAAKCGNCGKRYMPPKTYCTDCFLEIKEFPSAGPEGKVSAIAESHVDFQGRASRPRTFVFVSFKGVEGGLVHTAEGDGIKIGSRVRPRFRDAKKRNGTLLDIEAFVRA